MGTALLELCTTAAAQGRPAPITAYNAHGQRLPEHPTLRAGQRIALVVRGFAAGAVVTMVDMNAHQRRQAKATHYGVVRVAYRVPLKVRAGRPTAVAFAGAPAGGYRAKRKHGNTRADVPLYRRFNYRLRHHHHHGTKGEHTGSGGGLADTGFDALALLVAAGLAIVLGAVGLRAGRRLDAP